METNDASGSIVARLALTVEAALDDLRSRRNRYRIYRKTRAELMDLTDRELSDLGLNRTMIRSLALEAARKA